MNISNINMKKLPCHVTSAFSQPSGPNTTHAWSSDKAKWTSL